MFHHASQQLLDIINLDNDRIARLYDRKCAGKSSSWIINDFNLVFSLSVFTVFETLGYSSKERIWIIWFVDLGRLLLVLQAQMFYPFPKL